MDNKEGIFSGDMETELTKKGIQDAKNIAEKLKDEKIDLAFTSPLKRTKECVNYILEDHPDTKVITDTRIIEKDYGDLEGKSKEEFKREHPKLYPLIHRSYEFAPPGGESMEEVEERVNSFIEDMLEMIKKEKAKTVVIAAHGNSIRPIRKRFENLSIDEMVHIETGKGQLLEYTIDI